MSGKHTPGPWAFGSYSRLLIVPVIDGLPDKHLAIADLGETAVPFDKTEESAERYANAQLIAAAPELLAVLEEFSEYVHNEQSATDGAVVYSSGHITSLALKARAAIAKAEGEKA